VKMSHGNPPVMLSVCSTWALPQKSKMSSKLTVLDVKKSIKREQN
jgi:hypothetical protein